MPADAARSSHTSPSTLMAEALKTCSGAVRGGELLQRTSGKERVRAVAKKRGVCSTYRRPEAPQRSNKVLRGRLAALRFSAGE